MWNPFKTPIQQTMLYSTAPNTVRADTNSTVHANVVVLDDGYAADTTISPYRGEVDTMDESQFPDYNNPDSRELIYTPGISDGWNVANLEDRFANVVDPNPSLPGTVELNIMHGPVDGSAMDVYQEGNRQVLSSVAPGQYGPVVGGEDYSTVVSNAYWQQSFAQYSNAVSTEALIAAI